MKHEMSTLHATQTYKVLYGEGTEGKEGERPVSRRANTRKHTDKGINFMGRDGKQNVEASIQQIV